MKVAVCISGQPRHYELGFESLNNAVLSKYDCDIYIHTWWDDKGGNYSRSGFANSREMFESPKASDLPRGIDILYQPEVLTIEPQKNFVIKDKDVYKSPFVTPFNLYSQKYSIMRANELIKGEYDWVIRARFDLDLDLMDLDFSKYDKNHIYVNSTIGFQPKTDSNYGVDDCFAIGAQDIMNTYSECYNHLDYYFYEQKQKIACEHITYHHLAENNIDIHYDYFGLTFIGDNEWRVRNRGKDIIQEREQVRSKYGL